MCPPDIGLEAAGLRPC